MTGELVFLKLGGSLITDKDRRSTPRLDVLERLSAEIAGARARLPGLRLVVGHGSGSFGHTPARQHDTRRGVRAPAEWLGFAEVWREARALNQIVVDALAAAGLPVMALPPSAAVTARDGKVLRWDLEPLQSALDHGLLPLVNGDTIFDTVRGGTILSTEDLFIHLARELRPGRILLAGRERGVWEDFPACTRLVETITPASFPALREKIGGSASVDVTGGMLEKVRVMLDLAAGLPSLEVRIFSGREPGSLREALLGAPLGTLIRA